MSQTFIVCDLLVRRQGNEQRCLQRAIQRRILFAGEPSKTDIVNRTEMRSLF
ncbi:hypothetical protein [Nostoc sp.]|uniref:hypothetical protein n=1 Tax=Nostoc sp. TaxID=1180 RepID=UPI002FFB8508